MLATPCPACGASNPTCLPSPLLYRCDLCKYEGHPRAQDVPEIEAMARTVRAMERRSLQLDRTASSMLTSARGARAIYLLVLALLLFPTILTTGIVDWVSGAAEIPLPGLTLAPAIVMLVAAIASALLVQRRHQTLIAGCAADPPRAGDEAGRCSVCGGPLASGPGAVVARCGFCGADNIVSEATLARVERAHETGAALFERRLRGRQQAMRGATRTADALVIAVPVLAFVLITAGAFHVLDEVRDVNASAADLSAVVLAQGVCFGRADGDAIDFGPTRSDGLSRSLPLPRKAPYPRGPRVSRLRGGEVVLEDGGHGTVARVFVRDRAPWIAVRGARGTIERPVLGACVVDRRF